MIFEEIYLCYILLTDQISLSSCLNFVIYFRFTLPSSKSHGYDNISIKMMKICSESVTIVLKIILEESLKKGIFPEIWKKANVVPIHKKRQNFNKKLPPY